MTTATRDFRVTVPEGSRGPWTVERFTVSEEDARMFNLRASLNPMERFRSIDPGTYTRLRHERTVIMSDTPAEVWDHYEPMFQIRQRGGRVLIHGLGLGLVLTAALKVDEVERVDVVELDPDVINLVGPHYEVDPRVHIHHGDALTYRFPPGQRWSVAWHDIWPAICADNLPDMHRLHRRYGCRVDWQGSWSRELLEAYER